MNDQKTILLDLRNLNNPTSGFGQIARNYAHLFGSLNEPDLRFVFLIPENFSEDIFGQAKVVRYTKEMRRDSRLLPKVDLWHSVNQQQKVRRIDDGTKFVLTIHDLNYLTEKNWLRQMKHNLRLGRMIRHADAVTAISGYVAKQVESNFAHKLEGKPVATIYDAVESISNKTSTKPTFASGRPFFFTIGQIRMKKNFHLLVDVMKAFPDHDLYICGDDHFEAAKVIRKKIKEGNVNNVRLCGKISEGEKIWLYSNCEAFLFPSQGEGFGLPVIEAMQFGKPVLVSPHTCLPEISGGHAFVWSDVHTSTMVDGIKNYLPEFYSDKDKSQKVRDYGHSFTYERHVSQYLALYRNVLNLG